MCVCVCLHSNKALHFRDSQSVHIDVVAAAAAATSRLLRQEAYYSRCLPDLGRLLTAGIVTAAAAATTKGLHIYYTCMHSAVLWLRRKERERQQQQILAPIDSENRILTFNLPPQQQQPPRQQQQSEPRRRRRHRIQMRANFFPFLLLSQSQSPVVGWMLLLFSMGGCWMSILSRSDERKNERG